MDEMFFYDANAGIGRTPMDGGEPDAKGLLADMDYYGIEKALVRHNNIDMLGALQTNREITGILETDDPERRLTGVWCILPEQCGEMPPPDELFRRMKANRIGALILSPRCHFYIPCRLTVGGIMDAARERRVPVFLDKMNSEVPGMEGWEMIYRFMAEFPENICILCDFPGKWGHDRQVRPLLENYGGFYYATSGYWNVHGIRDYARKYGAERFLYGSGFPYFGHGSQMTQIRHSGLSAAEAALIAGGNLKRLMEEEDL